MPKFHEVDRDEKRPVAIVRRGCNCHLPEAILRYGIEMIKVKPGDCRSLAGHVSHGRIVAMNICFDVNDHA